MQTNLDDFFLCDNSEQTFSVNSSHDNNVNNSYRDIQNYYMDQFNQSYMCVTSSTETMINDRSGFLYNQNCEDQNHCSSYEYWNLYNNQSSSCQQKCSVNANEVNDTRTFEIEGMLRPIKWIFNVWEFFYDLTGKSASRRGILN